MSQNCRVKPIAFVVTLNNVNNELRLHTKNNKFVHITKSYLDYYKANYNFLKEGNMMAKIWHFKSKKK